MKKIQQKISILACTGLLAILGGCSTSGSNDSKLNPVSLPPLKVKEGNCGNEPAYTLQGQTYQVLPSAIGYREEGSASWYGAEFQGGETAGCEVFDMHAFSAAHRTLPLPSFVRVTHLQNGKSVIVRVNDRGPFEGGGLIQLSFAAANALGMAGKGNAAPVRVEALDAQQQAQAASSQPASVPRGKTPSRPSPAQSKAIQEAKQSGKSFYVVVNNYQEQGEALEMFVRLTSVGLSKTEMATAMQDGRNVHQVRVGPLYTQDQIDNVKDALENNGLATFRVVAVNQ